MKKITLSITLLLAVFAISSCKKDKKEEVSILVGKQWDLSGRSSTGNTYAGLFNDNIKCIYTGGQYEPKASKNGKSTLEVAPPVVLPMPTQENGISPLYIVFNADGTWVNNYDNGFKTCVDGTNSTIAKTGTWKIEGDKFTLNNMYKTMPTMVFTIKTLTATSFIIEIGDPNTEYYKQEYEIYNPNYN